jgi:hypothetical protein
MFILQETFGIGGYLPWSAEINIRLPCAMTRSEARGFISARIAADRLPQRIEALALTQASVGRDMSPPMAAYRADIGTHARVLLRADTLEDVRPADRA